ncbi:hypothetical protein [Stenotrophomonas daejeonensis]|uniref:hypothetical protein n=1 Tax=Stenotrophomonas daejeonensis TaxID=659018 RepID=UPI00128F5D2C|nr:hypothetical protein [Stenotrophomonas daejeonensis]
MNMKLVIAIFATSLGSTVLAQETKPIPPHEDWMSFCMEGEEIQQPNGVFGSHIDRVFSEAMCQCHFEHLPANGTMTESQYTNAGATCFEERKKILPNLPSNIRTSKGLPSRAMTARMPLLPPPSRKGGNS